MPFYTSFPWKENIILTVYSIEDPFLKNYLEIKWELCPQRFHGKIVCFCTALPRVKFLSNPRRMHSKGEGEEKEDKGLPRAPSCCSTTFPAPSPSPPPHTPRAYWAAWDPLSGHVPPPHCKQARIQWFWEKVAKKCDSLFLETQKWHGWNRTAFVILYKLEWKW